MMPGPETSSGCTWISGSPSDKFTGLNSDRKISNGSKIVMTSRQLERDFGELYISEGDDRRHLGEKSRYATSHSHGPGAAKPGYKNGLATFTPVVYPNPADDSDDEDEDNDDNFPPPRPSYQQLIPQPLPKYYSTSSSYPVSTAVGVSAVHSSTFPPQRVHMAQSSRRIDSHPLPPRTSGQSYYGNESYIPPPVPSQASYGSVQSGYQNQMADMGPVNPGQYRDNYPYQPHQSNIMRAPQVPVSEIYHPQGVSSKILYTTPSAGTQGFVQSRPANPNVPPPPVKETPSHSPANYVNVSYGTDTGPGHAQRPTYTMSEQYSPDSASDSQYSPTGGRTYSYQPDQGNLPLSSPRQDDVEKLEGKEAEVDALTNMLLQNMEAAADPDFFGNCNRCQRPVLGQYNACSALDQVYHIKCFLCRGCGITLGGQPFFSMEGKPYCETCYMDTLEKCSVCSKSITDRVLRATGKPYHPACFTCVVCGKSLDGIPFTVDATNQIHCIEDFHKKFAPRCCVCGLPIMPQTGREETVRIVAMDKSFHTECYKCEDCGLVLSSEAEGRGCYPLDDHLLCKHCNAKCIQAMTTKMTTEL